MKKILCTVLCLVLFVPSCAPQSPYTQILPALDKNISLVVPGLSIRGDCYPIGSGEIYFSISNNTGSDVYIDMTPTLERKADKEWETVGTISGDGVDASNTARQHLDGKLLLSDYEPLDYGDYRLSFKHVDTDGNILRILYALFSITEPALDMKIKDDTLTPDGCTLLLTNMSENDFIYGGDFFIERNDGDGWKAVELVVDSLAFTQMGRGLPAGKTAETDLPWNFAYGSLGRGDYRVGKSAHTGGVGAGQGGIKEYYVYAEFTIG